MKKLILVASLIISLPSIAQEKEKFATFGFDLGVNRSNLNFGSTQNNGDEITNGMGYRLGVISNFRISQRFAFQPKIELSFNAGRLETDQNDFKVSPVNLELIGHLKYKFSKNSFSPYIIAGPNFRVPLEDFTNNLVPSKQNVAIDIGVGLDVPIGKLFKFSPELRYSYGLSTINRDSEFSDIKYHNIALVVNFR